MGCILRSSRGRLGHRASDGEPSAETLRDLEFGSLCDAVRRQDSGAAERLSTGWMEWEQCRPLAGACQMNNFQSTELSPKEAYRNAQRESRMQSIGDVQLEQTAVGAASAMLGSPEGFRNRYRAGLDITHKCASKLFEIAQSNLTSLFEYTLAAAQAPTLADFTQVTGNYWRTQSEAYFRQLNDIVAIAQKAAVGPPTTNIQAEGQADVTLRASEPRQRRGGAALQEAPAPTPPDKAAPRRTPLA